MVEAFLTSQQFQLESSDNKLSGHQHGDRIVLTFDALVGEACQNDNRLVNIEVNLSPKTAD